MKTKTPRTHDATPTTNPNDPAASASGRIILAQRTLVVVGVVVVILILLLLVWYAADLLLLVFAGVLVANLLRSLSRPLHTRTGLSAGLALTLVILVIVAVIALVGWVVADRVGSQVNELAQQLPVAIAEFNQRLERYTWVQQVIAALPGVGEAQGRSGLLTRITGLASATLNVVVNIVVVVIVGIYLAAQPDLYAGGVKRLLPFRYRPRAGEVLGVLDDALGRWLLGRFALMVVNGSLTALGLWLLGVPLTLTLGLLAGLFNFIPNFGPLIAAVPAILIALLQSPQVAIYTTLLYLAIQMIDGYLFTPLVDRRSVALPPVLTITAQLLLGLLFGFIGLLVASPLAATVLILVKLLYIEDLLGDRMMQESSKSRV